MKNGVCDYGLVCDQNILTPLNEYGVCQKCYEQSEHDNEWCKRHNLVEMKKNEL